MKLRICTLVVALAVTACGGNYSNDDLAFLNALPHKEDLQAQVPSTGTTTGALQTRRDGLAVGEPSKTYTDTKNAAQFFNGVLDFFLGIVDTVRKHPPTTRHADERVWGPWKDDKHPAWEVRMVMNRDADQFTWKIEFRPRTSTDDSAWIKALDGKFLATSGVRKGKGEVHFYAHAMRAAGLNDASDDGKLAQMDTTYETDVVPSSVDMQLTGEPTSGIKSLDFSYRDFGDGAATMIFLGTAPDGATLDIRSGWNKTGAGKANTVYTKGTTTMSADPADCWDSEFRVTYASHPWEGIYFVGDAANCPSDVQL